MEEREGRGKKGGVVGAKKEGGRGREGGEGGGGVGWDALARTR